MANRSGGLLRPEMQGDAVYRDLDLERPGMVELWPYEPFQLVYFSGRKPGDTKRTRQALSGLRRHWADASHLLCHSRLDGLETRLLRRVEREEEGVPATFNLRRPQSRS